MPRAFCWNRQHVHPLPDTGEGRRRGGVGRLGPAVLMEPAGRKKLEAAIRAERGELEALSRSTREDRAPVELDQQAVGRLSRMDAIQRQSMDLAKEERRRRRLRLLDAALDRLAADDYGYCLACGRDIAFERLEADPAAARCIDCTGKAP